MILIIIPISNIKIPNNKRVGLTLVTEDVTMKLNIKVTPMVIITRPKNPYILFVFNVFFILSPHFIQFKLLTKFLFIEQLNKQLTRF